MPIFIEELCLNDWRTFRGKTRIRFHENSGMSAIIGQNGSGKTSLLDSLAFVTCATGIDSVDLSGMTKRSFVAISLTDGSEFRRYGDGSNWIDNECLLRDEYAIEVRSRLKTFFITQLTGAKEFFDPLNLAQFIEAEHFDDVQAPPIISEQEFKALEQDVRTEYRLWKDARQKFLNVSADLKVTKRDLARMHKLQKSCDIGAHLERCKQLLLHLQIVEAQHAIENKLRFVDSGISRLTRSVTLDTDAVHHLEVELKKNNNLLVEILDSIEHKKDIFSETNAKIPIVLSSLNDITVQEINTRREIYRSQRVLEALTPIRDQVTNSLIEDIPSHAAQEFYLEATNLDQGTAVPEEEKGVPLTAPKQRSAIYEWSSLVRNVSLKISEANYQATKLALDKYRFMVSEQIVTKQQLNERLALNTQDKEYFRVQTIRMAEQHHIPRMNNRFSSSKIAGLKRLKNIPGVIGVLHELVRPHPGYESLVWSVLGEDADLLVVIDKTASIKCWHILKQTSLPLVSGIMNLEDFAKDSKIEPDWTLIENYIPDSIALRSLLEVDAGPYQDLIRQFSTKNALVVSHHWLNNLREKFPELTFCDSISGCIITPEGIVKGACEYPTETRETDYQQRTHLYSAPSEEGSSLGRNASEKMQLNRLSMLSLEYCYLYSHVEALENSITRLKNEIRDHEKLANEAQIIKESLSAEKGKVNDIEYAKIVEKVAFEFVPGISTDGQWVASNVYGAKQLKRDSLILIDYEMKAAERSLESCLLRENLRREETEELNSLQDKQSSILEDIKELTRQGENVHAHILECDNKLCEAHQQYGTHEHELSLLKMLKASFMEDERYLSIAERATMTLIDQAYRVLSVHTRRKEESEVLEMSRIMHTGTLLKKYESQISQLPIGLRSMGNEVRNLKQLTETGQAELEQVRIQQTESIQRLDRSMQKLEQARKSRRERMTMNLNDLMQRAVTMYQTIAVGRQAVPFTPRLFLSPLDETSPWKGVFCACHPVGKQCTPVVQLSHGERAIAQLCITMSALLADGTKLVLYDEVDTDLDLLKCNALGNFIRKRTGSPGGGQAMIVTHRRPTYNTAHNLIGLYRTGNKDEDSTRVVTHRRRIDPEHCLARRATRPRNPVMSQYTS